MERQSAISGSETLQAVYYTQNTLVVLFQVAVNGANLQNVFMLLTLEPLLARSPFLVLHVRRNHLVGDALRELSIHSDIDLKKPLKVSPFSVPSCALVSIWQQRSH